LRLNSSTSLRSPKTSFICWPQPASNTTAVVLQTIRRLDAAGTPTDAVCRGSERLPTSGSFQPRPGGMLHGGSPAIPNERPVTRDTGLARVRDRGSCSSRNGSLTTRPFRATSRHLRIWLCRLGGIQSSLIVAVTVSNRSRAPAGPGHRAGAPL
jgi:hypothetical protein